jgi:catechol 1,2-dioxygenase
VKPTQNERLKTIYDDLTEAIGDVIVKHGVTEQQFETAVNWLVDLGNAGEIPLYAMLAFGFPLAQANHGVAYANPDKDGASTWYPAGPAYVPGAPQLDRPYVLPQRPDERGEVLFVSGTVRSTTGEPVSGALVDIWLTDTDGHYSNLTKDMLGVVGAHIDESLPSYNLRGRLTTDEHGSYEYRAIVPGIEEVGVPPGGPLERLVNGRDRVGVRPRHLHAIVSHDGFHTLTHQIHFDGDPIVDRVIEGAVAKSTVLKSELHDDPADFKERGLNEPYRTLICDYVLRPVPASF